jgi:hypothetical protein
MPAELMFEMFESRLFERLAGARSDSLRDSFAISSVFNGLRIGKFRGPRILRPADFPRRGGWTRGRDSFWFGDTVAAVASAFSERERIRRVSNSVSFDFNGLQGGKFSLPAGRPALGPLRRAREAGPAGDRARPCGVRPRARCSVAPPRRSAAAALARSTPRLAGGGQTCGGGISERAWPWRILVIGGRTKRVARLRIFRNKISQIRSLGCGRKGSRDDG